MKLREKDACRWDLVALGEVMLRLDPGDRRIATARTFEVCEGGGEYNVARALRRCFGQRTAVVTALADNPVGRLIEDLMLQGGVEPAHLGWIPYDGIGREVRNGLNFTERGFGVRPALGCSDRANSAASQLRSGDVDWERIFGAEGARWFHCGGVFGALSRDTAAVALEGMEAARQHGTIVSFDLNYRPSLWAASGGPERAAAVNAQLVAAVDVLLGNEEDLSAAFGYELEGMDDDLLALDVRAYERLLQKVVADHPHLSLVAITLRSAHTATVNDWGAVCQGRSGFHVGPQMQRLEIFDRVGGGDSFASGLIFGLLEGRDLDTALAYGVAHGALAMTTPGDVSMATLAEVERLMAGGSARVQR
jgi:2-dehydro-3-deoxygluconokinase